MSWLLRTQFEEVIRLWWFLHTLEKPANLWSKLDWFYMNFKTMDPNPIPRKVATAIPKIPTRIPGIIIELQPFVVAIPQAVVGPPTLALDAISNDLRSKRSSFPRPMVMTRWTAIWTRENMKILGAVLMTLHTFPLAPTTVKKTCLDTMQFIDR